MRLLPCLLKIPLFLTALFSMSDFLPALLCFALAWPAYRLFRFAFPPAPSYADRLKAYQTKQNLTRL